MVPNESKLLSLMSSNDVTFFIPPYQRNYEWNDEQCEVFLDDVDKTYKQNTDGIRSEHFFGSITYFKSATPFNQPDRLVLIDGQQRITTVMLFLVALRDLTDDEALKEFITNKYLKNNSVSDDTEYKIKLKQVETDWHVYMNIILGQELTNKDKMSAVYRNYQYFRNQLLGYKNEGVDLSSLIEKGLATFSVITIELEPDRNEWENPQEIFESMNSLGKPLSLADLVRNFLLLGLDADTQTRLYRQYWLSIEQSLPGKVSDFIRDYMQYRRRRSFPKATDTNHKKLYAAFKEEFHDFDAEELLKDFKSYAKTYAYIVGESSSGNKKIDARLADLRRLNVTTAYSFLMACLKTWENERFSNQDMTGILDTFFVYCLRRRILRLTQGENKSFPQLANKVSDLEAAADKKLKMFEILSFQENALRLPNDAEMNRGLSDMNFFNFQPGKFCLCLIEESLTKHRPDMSDEKLQVEHIMPQTLNASWKDALGSNFEAVHQELVHNIGNLTLIRHNQELGNKPFEEKKQVYENKAGLQIARTKIIDRNSWNEKAIRDRADWLIDLMVTSVLPIPDSMRRTNNFVAKKRRTSGTRLSFKDLDLIGSDINFIADPSIIAHVVGDTEVEFEGRVWKLSPLTRELYTRQGTVNASGSYQGAQYWEYDGIKLAEIM